MLKPGAFFFSVFCGHPSSFNSGFVYVMSALFRNIHYCFRFRGCTVAPAFMERVPSQNPITFLSYHFI